MQRRGMELNSRWLVTLGFFLSVLSAIMANRTTIQRYAIERPMNFYDAIRECKMTGHYPYLLELKDEEALGKQLMTNFVDNYGMKSMWVALKYNKEKKSYMWMQSNETFKGKTSFKSVAGDGLAIIKDAFDFKKSGLSSFFDTDTLNSRVDYQCAYMADDFQFYKADCLNSHHPFYCQDELDINPDNGAQTSVVTPHLVVIVYLVFRVVVYVY